MQRLVILLSICSLFSCGQTAGDKRTASFEFFSYQGKDSLYDTPIDRQKEYFNPVLAGFYPDPSICRKGNDYYLVTSSFAYFPGIPIFHSRDLVHWQQIGHVLDRPSQLRLDGVRISGGIYAPAIRYNPDNDTFYLVSTCVDGIGNFVVKTKDPRKGWSEPIALPKVQGIDPSLFFDDDGKAYLVHNGAPLGKPEWEGHRAIWMHEYDLRADSTFDRPQLIVDGGVDKSKEPIWIEAPHLYKVDGKYYLMAAEGGTGENHSEVIFSSGQVWGTYKPHTQNPILTQRDLPEERTSKVTCAGHADMIKDREGNWWAVFLACRPYEKNYYNTGRETFLLPVEWKEGYPLILPPNTPIPLIAGKPGLEDKQQEYTGNLGWRDEFDSPELALRWNFIRTPRPDLYKIDKGLLLLDASPFSIDELCNPSFIGARQQHACFEVASCLSFSPRKEDDWAGLVCFQNEDHYLLFGKTIKGGKEVLSLVRKEKDSRVIADVPLKGDTTDRLFLKIQGEKGIYRFYMAYEDLQWKPVEDGVDATHLSTAKAGGFTGTMIGMYASSK